MNDINEQSNSLSIGFAPLEMKISKVQQNKPKFSNLNDKIDSLKHKLITSMEIITNTQIRTSQFRKQLKNFRYQKKSKSTSIFSESTIIEQKQLQQQFFTLKDLFSQWRDSLKHKFFITFSNGDLIYFLHKQGQYQSSTKIQESMIKLQESEIKLQECLNKEKKGDSFMIISSKRNSFTSICQNLNIPFTDITSHLTFHQKNPANLQVIQLINNSIQILWKHLVNQISSKSMNFQVVSNFLFLNSSEFYPIEAYNGSQKREQFQHLASKKSNILGQHTTQLYSIKIEGLWFQQNAQLLHEKLKSVFRGKPFQMLFQCHSGSQLFGKSM